MTPNTRNAAARHCKELIMVSSVLVEHARSAFVEAQRLRGTTMLESLQHPKRGAQSRSSSAIEPGVSGVSTSIPEEADRHAGHIHLGLEHTPGLWVAGPHLFALSIAQARHEQHPHVRASETGHGWLRDRHRYAVEKSAIHRQAVETAGRDPCAPVATVAVRCCAVRPSFFVGERPQAGPA